MLTQNQIHIRVRYAETDGQGYVHHANYFHYFEQGRVELLRAQGVSYRDLEAKGYFLVVADLQCRYRAPAKFDDELILRTKVTEVGKAKVHHSYELLRGNQILSEAKSVIACIDAEGKIRRLPEELVP